MLCYHAVSDDWPAALSVTPAALEHQLTRLVRAGWLGTTFTDAVAAPPRGRVLAVTFDDGFASVAQRAAPILERLGLPGTVFVPVDWPGRDEPMRWPGIDRWLGTPWERELLPMGWEDYAAMTARGWEIGSHTCSHPRLTELTDAALAHELSASRSECERRLGRPCRALAYPFGALDARVVAAASHAGYEAATGLPGSVVRPSRLAYPRVGVWHTDAPWRFRLKTSRTAARASVAGSPLERARAALRGSLRG